MYIWTLTGNVCMIWWNCGLYCNMDVTEDLEVQKRGAPSSTSCGEATCAILQILPR